MFRTLSARLRRNSHSLAWPALVALILVPALLVGMLLEVREEFARSRELREAVNQSYDSRLQLGRVFSLIQDAETGQRGYIITGQAGFLEPYESARGAIREELARLRALEEAEAAGASDAALAELDALERLVDAKIENLGLSIALRETQGAAAANALVSTGRGKAIMDDIRVQVALMSASEAVSLSARTAAVEALTRRSERMIGGMFVLLGLLLAAAVMLVLRQSRARQALLARGEAAAARNEAIFESTHDALITFNRSGSIETINRAGEAMFGYARAALSRREVGLLLDIPDDGRLFLERLLRNGELEAGVTREFQARRRDGTAFPAEVALAAFELPDGLRVVAAVRDITERRRVERMKAEFVSTVSHELRTPLTSIAGSLGLLTGGAAGALPDKAGRLVAIAHGNCQRLVRLINDILDIEKMESGAMAFVMAPLPLDGVVRRSIDGLQGLAGELGVRFDLAVEPGLELAVGDADRLTQVVHNLLGNAAKFSPPGGVVEVALGRAGAGKVRLSVRDHGPGVPEAFRERLFSKFAQADASDTRRKGGTGLGLAITKEIVERHGGRVWYEPAVGGGACFQVELPAERRREDAPSGPCVLICEDDADAAEVLAQAGTAEGFSARITGSIAEAEAALGGEARFVALLLDMRLPDGAGPDLLRKVRAAAHTRDLPVLIVSGEAAEGRVHTFEVLDWLQKPVDLDRLRGGLAAALRDRATRPLILHVEDDADIRQVVRDALSDSCEVVAAESLAAARALLRTVRPRLAILDIALADGSGLEVVPMLEASGGAPVIVFSAQPADDPELARSLAAVLTKSRNSLDELGQTVRRLVAAPDPAPRPEETAA